MLTDDFDPLQGKMLSILDKDVGGTIERFTEYRAQFEEIASNKYDRGHLERDGNVCIRGRDLPGRDH